MSEQKRVALLRGKICKNYNFEDVRGVLRYETLGEIVRLSLSLLNLKPSTGDKYYFCFYGGEFYYFELENTEKQTFSLKKTIGGTVGGGGLVVLFSQGEVYPVAYGSFDEKNNFEEIFSYAKKIFKAKSAEEKSGTILESQKEIYDDEQIATENYFRFSDEREGERSITEDTPSESFGYVQEEDSGEEEFCEEIELGEEKCERVSEERAEERQEKSKEREEEKTDEIFYYKIEKRLNQTLADYPKEENLCSMVKNSRWVKVTSSDGKSYAVGVIKENGVPKYVCYGILGNYLEKPTSLKGYASFIPLSPFDKKGEGYWVMFQDAIKGVTLSC